MTLLHSTAYFNSSVCALYLLYQDLDINAVDKEGKSVFHLCAYTGHLDVLKVCI
jgi:ankyrin repeat protein